MVSKKYKKTRRKERMENEQKEQEGWAKKWRENVGEKKTQKEEGKNIERSKRKREEGEAHDNNGTRRGRTREGRERRRASSEYRRGIRVGKGAREEATWRYPPEKRWKYWSGMSATTCTERALVLLRHPVALLPLFAFLPPLASSTGSPLSPRVSLFPYLVSLFPPFVSGLAYSALFTLFFWKLILPFFSLSQFILYLFIYLCFLAFIDFNLLFFLTCLSTLVLFRFFPLFLIHSISFLHSISLFSFFLSHRSIKIPRILQLTHNLPPNCSRHLIDLDSGNYNDFPRMK